MVTDSIFADLPMIETDRLLLRKLRSEDALHLFEYASDPLVAASTTWEPHNTIYDSNRFISFMNYQYEKGEVSNWGIEFKENHKLIGTCGFVYWDQEHRRAEIGYALSRVYWNQGIMSEAAEAIVNVGFEFMNLNRIEARCNLSNVGSERVMQKAGMSYEGILRDHLWVKTKFESVKMYSILKSDWLSG